MKWLFLDLRRQVSQHGNAGLVLWLILGLGTLLRVATLGRQSLWLDEGWSYWLVNRSWQAMLMALPSSDPHPPLYYLMLHSILALGRDEWLLRLPSALASIVSIGLLFTLGREVFEPKTALMAAFIFAISPFQLWYAQEARMYAVVTALTIAASLFAMRALRTNNQLDWLLFGLFEGLALWTDTAAIWFVLAANAAFLISIKAFWRARQLWPWIAAQFFALFLFLPWLPTFIKQLSGGFAGWIPPATFTILARTLTDFFGSYEKRSTLGSIIALFVLLFPLLLAAPAILQDALTRKVKYIFLICGFLIPIVLAFLLSQPYFRVPLLSLLIQDGHSIFLTRNLILTSIPLFLLLARSLVLSSPPIRTTFIIVLVAISCISYSINILGKSKEDFRSATEIIREQAKPEDLFLFAPPYLELPFSYYWDRSPSVEVNINALTDGVFNEPNLQPGQGSIKELIGDHPRVWLIMTSNNFYRQDSLNAKQILETEGILLKTWQTNGVSVYLYSTAAQANLYCITRNAQSPCCPLISGSAMIDDSNLSCFKQRLEIR